MVSRRLPKAPSSLVVVAAHAVHFAMQAGVKTDEGVKMGRDPQVLQLEAVDPNVRYDSQEPQAEGRPRSESITSTEAATVGVSYLRIVDVDDIDPVAMTYVAMFSHVSRHFINRERARGSFVEEIPRSAVPFAPSADLQQLRSLRQSLGDDFVAVQLGKVPAVELIPPQAPQPTR